MFLELHYKSSQLNRDTSVHVLLPDECLSAGESYRTLWLLHGLSGDHTSWMRYSAIERYARERRLAVVMPDGGRSWYTDTVCGANYFSFIATELPELCRRSFRGMSEKCEDNIVAGLSMGGYGALKLTLSRPEQYGACISLSGSLDITRKGRPCNLAEWQSIFGYGLQSPLELEGSEHDLFALAARNRAEGKPFPSLYLWCGTEDSLIEVNRRFDRHLTDLDVSHTFECSEGDHTWRWWDLHIKEALDRV